MRAMKLGDSGFFYHSNDGKAVVGIVEVCRLAHRDSTSDVDTWECVDIRAVADVPMPVTLDEIKARPEAQGHGAGQELAALGSACDRGRVQTHLQAGRREGLNPAVSDRTAFIRANTAVMAPPLVPEVRLHLAHEAVPIWQKTEEELGEIGLPPPFWAFAWAGGQALARHLLDHPEIVRGRRVIDLASGSGLVGIAAMKAGAASVLAADIDGFAVAAIGLNAAGNGVELDIDGAMTSSPRQPPACDVILVGDLFYEKSLAARVLCLASAGRGAWHRRADRRSGPQLPAARRNWRSSPNTAVPVTRDLEDAEIKRTAVWRLSPELLSHRATIRIASDSHSQMSVAPPRRSRAKTTAQVSRDRPPAR